jgi:hypothetical protein
MTIEQEVKRLREEGYIEGELSIDPLWYIIWEPENIEQYNIDYELQKYAPRFIAFGSNGGNELLVVDQSGCVYSLPAIGMEPKYANKIAENIQALKAHMEKST